MLERKTPDTYYTKGSNAPLKQPLGRKSCERLLDVALHRDTCVNTCDTPKHGAVRLFRNASDNRLSRRTKQRRAHLCLPTKDSRLHHHRKLQASPHLMLTLPSIQPTPKRLSTSSNSHLSLTDAENSPISRKLQTQSMTVADASSQPVAVRDKATNL